MPGIAGLGVTYDLPPMVGALFRIGGKNKNALLRLAGFVPFSATAVRVVSSSKYPVAVAYDLEAAAQPAVLEGADAPTAQERTLAQQTNISQIFHEAVTLSFSAQSNVETIGGLAVLPGEGQGTLLDPGSLEFQIGRRMEKIAQDMNFSFVQGLFQDPANNATARKTRGLRTAITTNVFANAGAGRDLTKAVFEGALKSMVNGGHITMGAQLVALGNADQVENLVDLYKSDTRLPESREVAGVSIRSIVTTWGVVDVVFEPDMTAGEIVLTSIGFVQPVFRRLVVQGADRGIFISEPIAKTGSADKWQLYAEAGLAYGDERLHGLIDDLNA